jgi:uncharacterized protein (DUF58 family)
MIHPLPTLPPAPSRLLPFASFIALSRFHVPRPGWLWLLLCAMLVGIGMFKGINLLLLLSCMMVMIWLLNALLAGRRLRRLLGQSHPMGPVFAQTRCEVEAKLTNPERRGRMAVRLEDHGPAHRLVWFAPRLNGQQTRSLRQPLYLPRRGRYSWGPLVAVSGYPFGLIQRRVVLAAGAERIVLPRLGRLHWGRLRRHLRYAFPSMERDRPLTHQRLAAQTEFHGLRPFRSGDSPKWIHWRTTARRNELMVRQFEDPPGNNLILVVDPWLAVNPAGKDERSSALLEDALSLAATICWEWCRQQGERIVLAVASPAPVTVAGDTSHNLAIRLLETLAVQEGNPARERTAVVEELSRHAMPAAPVLLITTGGRHLEPSLTHRLNRPVAVVQVEDLAQCDFYERPPDHAS